MELSLETIEKVAYALGIGVLIGLERTLVSAGPEKTDGEAGAGPEDNLLGVRTYSIMSLSGLTAAMVGSSYPAVAAVLILGIVGLVLIMYFHAGRHDPGITTEISAVASCGLGALCQSQPEVAGVVALIVTALLASKRFLERTLRRLNRMELNDTLKFLAIILIVLPLLPNRALDPWGAFNPHKVMFLVVLISGIGFVGYFLTKFLGAEQGLGLTGILGGLTSSTAVTAAMASQAKAAPSLANPCALAAVIANATMFGRVLVVAGVLDRALALVLARSIAAMTAAAAIAAFILWRRTRKEKAAGGAGPSGEIKLKNPFSLGPALKFAAFFVGILLVAKIAKMHLGDQGLYLAALVSGLADVDAITLSIAEQTKGGTLAHAVGAVGVTIAVASNSAVKSGIAVYSGGWKFGSLVGAILLLATGAGLAVLTVLGFLLPGA